MVCSQCDASTGGGGNRRAQFGVAPPVQIGGTGPTTASARPGAAIDAGGGGLAFDRLVLAALAGSAAAGLALASARVRPWRARGQVAPAGG